MAYDLHVTRPEPISRDELDRVIAGDPELSWSLEDYVDIADEDGLVARYPLICWRGRPCFWLWRGEVLCSGPEDHQIVRLIQMAESLGARVVGDEGERYEIRKGWFGWVGIRIQRV